MRPSALKVIHDTHTLISNAKEGRLGAVRSDVRHGVNVNARDKEGWSAIMHAYSKRHADVVKFLKSEDAEFSEEDKIAAQMSASLSDECKVITRNFGEAHTKLARTA